MDNEFKTILLKLPQDLHATLKAVAAFERKSVNALFNEIVASYCVSYNFEESIRFEEVDEETNL